MTQTRPWGGAVASALTICRPRGTWSSPLPQRTPWYMPTGHGAELRAGSAGSSTAKPGRGLRPGRLASSDTEIRRCEVSASLEHRYSSRIHDTGRVRSGSLALPDLLT